METISEIDLTAAIKNCKVLIAIVSDQFEKEAKCRDILIYAKETLNKDIIVVVSGESMDWQTKDMGMKIGAQEVRLHNFRLSLAEHGTCIFIVHRGKFWTYI